MREARALLAAGLPDGAYYLAGYAVECALKACIAKATQKHDFPDKQKVERSYSHKLSDLVRVAGLEELLLEQARTDDAFRANWNVVQLWSEQRRYERQGAELAQALVNAIMDPSHGVIRWIRLHW